MSSVMSKKDYTVLCAEAGATLLLNMMLTDILELMEAQPMDAEELLEAMIEIHNAKQDSLKKSLVKYGIAVEEDTHFSMNDIAEKVTILQTV